MPDPRDSAPIFDLFVSYAHADDRDLDHLKVTALVDAIKADYLRVTGSALLVFFDVDEIRAMDAWESRILQGLRQSRMMVAVLSPAYFASPYRKKEWEEYVETELAHALPGEGITPIYVVDQPGFESGPVESRLQPWLADLRRRQYINWKEFWPHGASALEREDVRQRLDNLPEQIAERLMRFAIREASPNTVPQPSRHFVGRRDEMHRLLLSLPESQIGAITAVNGIAGIGKSMLAFAYAWGYGFKYPGGRFLIPAAGALDLAPGLIALAVDKNVPLTDDDRKQPEIALAKVKKAFEDGPPALLVIDNLDDPALLGPQSRERFLPRGTHIHVLVTTRVSPDNLPRVACLALDSLEPPDAIALLNSFRPIADAPQDDEWKAALEIVQRLGGHALAVEVAAVYLMDHPEVTCRTFAQTLEAEGISLMEEEVGPEVQPGQKWHPESCVARLLEPTLANLTPEELRAVEYAALLTPDAIPLPWLRILLLADFPTLAKARLGDKVQTIFNRLHRLRLIVPPQPDPKPTPEAADPRLARMHRLVQDVVRRRSGAEETVREEAVSQFAIYRGNWIERHWGKPGLAWELAPLRDMAMRMIGRGDLRGGLLPYRISTPLLHIGRFQDVKSLWLRTAELFKRLGRDEPNNPDHARDLSVSYEKLGELAISAGNSADARRYFQDGLEIARRLARDDPENAQYARDLSVSYEKLGELAISAGDSADARRYFQDGLEIARRLARDDPENAQYARDLSVSYEKLGELAISAGNSADARRYFQDGLEIARRLARDDPENAQYARDLSVSYEKLGELAISAGDSADARRYFQDGLEIRRGLARDDPENAQYARDLSVIYNRLGDLADSTGNSADARRYFQDGLEIRRGLARDDPENAQYARDLSSSYNRLGDLAVSTGDFVDARRYYQDALEIRKRLARDDPENAQYARGLWVSCWKIASSLEQDGNYEALTWWRQAWEILVGMKGRGMHISPNDEGVIEHLEDRFGFGR